MSAAFTHGSAIERAKSVEASADQQAAIAARHAAETEMADRIIGRMAVAVIGVTAAYHLSFFLAELLVSFGETVARWLA
ncbi:MAG: hypothetical protein KBE22_00055 [Candidatus Accumulibacter sp.]|nr:hypothetical protein [Accumulibacter sp.]